MKNKLNERRTVQIQFFDDKEAIEFKKEMDQRFGIDRSNKYCVPKGTGTRGAVFVESEIFKKILKESNTFSYYDSFDADVNFWSQHYDELADMGEIDPEESIVEYIAGKIEEEHPTESPEQFESLMRAVTAELKKTGYYKAPWIHD